ncbi:MT-A70-domain-containing protein, partial [Agrocybe pediades]
MSLHPSTSETLSSAHDLLAAHNALISQFRAKRKWLSQQTQELLRNSEKYRRENVTEDHNRKKRRRSSTATAVDWDEEHERAREDDDVDIDRDVYGDDDYDDSIRGDDGDDPVGQQSYSDGHRADTQSVKQEEDDGDDRQSLDDASDGAKSSDEDDYDPTEPPPRVIRPDLPPAKRARVERYPNYIPDEETIRNDYSQRYVDSGEWPQNWVLGAEPERRFEEYPKQQRLLNLKKQAVNEHSLPPHYLSLPLSPTDATTSTNTRFQNLLSTLHPSKFDVILIDPPFSSSFTWDNLQDLAIPSLAGDPSFVFLWVGSGAGEGLERGREVLAKWGYRRCEDVVWVKTNKTTNKGPGTDPPTTSLLTRTKQHCLIGIRGTVRRSNDSWFLHCNVDTDVIIWEGDPSDPARKPPEMYTLIENFCLGMRRLEIFGRLSSLRRGWVTVLAPGQE